MVGHTGNLEAAIEAVTVTDACVQARQQRRRCRCLPTCCLRAFPRNRHTLYSSLFTPITHIPHHPPRPSARRSCWMRCSSAAAASCSPPTTATRRTWCRWARGLRAGWEQACVLPPAACLPATQPGLGQGRDAPAPTGRAAALSAYEPPRHTCLHHSATRTAARCSRAASLWSSPATRSTRCPAPSAAPACRPPCDSGGRAATPASRVGAAGKRGGGGAWLGPPAGAPTCRCSSLTRQWFHPTHRAPPWPGPPLHGWMEQGRPARRGAGQLHRHVPKPAGL